MSVLRKHLVPAKVEVPKYIASSVRAHFTTQRSSWEATVSLEHYRMKKTSKEAALEIPDSELLITALTSLPPRVHLAPVEKRVPTKKNPSLHTSGTHEVKR